MNAHPFDMRIFSAPLLAELSQSVRNRIAQAGKTLHVPAGTTVFSEGQASDELFMLVLGTVQLIATPRGHDHPRVIRTINAFEPFGEEAILGQPRRAEARAVTEAVFVSIPGPLFRRGAAVAGESGGGGALDRLARTLRRNATKDILRAGLFFRDLPPADLAMAVDGARHREVRRSDYVYRAGDPSDWLYLVLEGMVQVQSEEGGEVRVSAYLSAGDFFGDDDIVAARDRKRTAVAMGHCQLLGIPARLFRTLADRNGDLLRQLQRTSIERREVQRQIVHESAAGDGAQSTRHVFADLYQMQMASSLLTIDQDLCVRCGHCTWTCNEVHGVARIVRRGDKTLTRLDIAGRDDRVRNLMLPNSCQHCRNPVCMIDCPTAAIGRDTEGEVFIREELCTGCANCAKACPWDNIQMAPRPKSSPIAASLLPTVGSGPAAKPLDVAVKCDLCREYAAPACVSACPTEAILRLDPSTDFRDVASLMGTTGTVHRSVAQRVNGAWPVAVAAVGIVLGIRVDPNGLFASAGSVGLVAGLLGALGMGMALSYAGPKRFPRLWLRRRNKRKPRQAQSVVRSKVRPLLTFHVAVGFLACAAVALHTQMRIPNNTAGAAALAFWFTSLLGVLSVVVYRSLPSRLTRLERKGLLPEDFAGERVHLEDRFRRALTAQSPEVQATANPVLLSYRRTPLVGVNMLFSGRSLPQEEERLRRQLRKRIPPALSGAEADLGEAIESVVALRALPARVWLMRALRVWLPLHMLTTAVLVGLVAVHIVGALELWGL